MEQPLNFHKGKAHTVFFSLCAKISQITPQINACFTPNTSSGCKSCLIFTHNPVQRTEETVGTPLADSRSDREGAFSKGLFPKPSLGIIREVRKLSDFLQQRAGFRAPVGRSSQHSADMTQNTYTQTRSNL